MPDKRPSEMTHVERLRAMYNDAYLTANPNIFMEAMQKDLEDIKRKERQEQLSKTSWDLKYRGRLVQFPMHKINKQGDR